MPKPNPTTREIAKACGYNQSTVSHALRGHAKIPAATRKLIRQTAEKMGWRANPLASAYMAHLRSTRTPSFQATLGFLTSHPTSNQISKLPFYMQRHFEGAQQRAHELGYALEPIWLHEPHLTSRRLASILRSRNISGLIIGGIQKPAPVLEQLDWKHYAVVAMGYSLPAPKVHRVAVDSSRGFHLMLVKAIELGYRHIGVIVSDSYDRRVNHGVYFPTYYMQKQATKAVRISTCHFAEPLPSEIKSIQAWIRRYRPEVILGEDIAWQAVKQMGWRVPQDVAFIINDWSPEYPKNAGFNQYHEHHGAVTTDFIISSILQNNYGLPSRPCLTLLEGVFCDGDSAPPIDKIGTVKAPVNL